MQAWVLTDGAAADEEPCLGVAEAVADRIERRRLKPARPWRRLAIRVFSSALPTDPATTPRPGEPWPDLVIAAGGAGSRLARIKRDSGGRTVTACLGRRGARSADVVWVFDTERLRGPNVVATPTSPHRIDPIRLAAARAAPSVMDPVLSSSAARSGGTVGVLLPGEDARFSAEDVARLVAGLRRLREQGQAIVCRAPPGAPEALRMAVREVTHYLWQGDGPDPYISMLARSDALVVVADSTGALSEATASGRPIMAFTPSRTPHAARVLLDRLTALGIVRPFSGRLERYAYAPLDATGQVARAIQALAATRAVLDRSAHAPRPALARETNGHDPR